MKSQKTSPLFQLACAAASPCRGLSLILLLVIVGVCAPLCAQDHAGDNIETFCEGDNACIPDSLVFRWDENNEAVLVLDSVGQDLSATVFLDTRSEGVTSWSYGLRHDPAVLTLLAGDCTDDREGFICGTDAADRAVEPFYNYSEVVGSEQGSEVGFISAVVLSFVAPAHLEAERFNSLAKLTYRVGEIPPGGTMVRFVADELRLVPDSPAVGIQIEVGGGGGMPSTLVHGKLELPFAGFLRGDVNDSGALEVTDAINFLTWMFLGGSAPGCMDAADADNNGTLGLSDGINILTFLFGGGDALPKAGLLGSGCAPDPEGEEDGLLCESYSNC
ncbi:MAG: hypothetical protein VCD16_14540 [Planctomycetota bacterium]